MRTNISAFALLLGMMITFTACEKDNATLLTDGMWKFENMTTDSEDEAVQSTVLIFKAYFTDGTLEFNADKTFILNAPLVDDPLTGTWSLAGDDQLIMTGGGDLIFTAVPCNIQSLTKKELKYLQTINDQTLGAFNFTTTWVKD